MRNYINFILVITIISTAYGQDCSNAKTQIEMNFCAKNEYENSDRLLNDIYLSINNKLDDKGRNLLKKAEVAWIKYRDAHCEAVINDFGFGSMAPLAKYSCLNLISKQRIETLRLSYPEYLRENEDIDKK